MSIWLGKFKEDTNLEDYENYASVADGDSVYLYTDDYESGTFQLIQKYDKADDSLDNDIGFDNKSIDLPYTLLYKTKSADVLIRMTEQEANFILNPTDYSQAEGTEEERAAYGSTIFSEINKTSFDNFLKVLEKSTPEIKPFSQNILFNIGQPNTGKSYNFEKTRIFNGADEAHYKYLKIPVSGGIGNEYKGLQNTDLAITYDPIKEELRFGEFLQMLMSAIVNPKVPHVVFLDDFHNQDISSLLSEYTPLFKGQQKREVNEIDSNPMFNDFSTVDEFIKGWNSFIDTHCTDAPIVPLTNRISGESLKLVYPTNFYLLGAANFNENSLNIFADWEDRAVIDYIDPIKTFDKEDENNEFLNCCIKLNTNLKGILELKNIFDYEKYCFGMWKIVDKDGNIESNLDAQKKIIDFFFSMIKNSLKYNNKNSEINTIGWELIVKMQEDNWFKDKIEALTNPTDIDYKVLHKHNIYEDEI